MPCRPFCVVPVGSREDGSPSDRSKSAPLTSSVNAVVQCRHLSPVSVIRLCGPASRAVPPFTHFPPDLRGRLWQY
ncbi:hypothetical protein ACOMHN_033434 [Nucella lapillus]